MAYISNIAKAFASPSASLDIPMVRDAGERVVAAAAVVDDNRAAALLTPPNSTSPELSAYGARPSAHSFPPPINVDREMEWEESGEPPVALDGQQPAYAVGVPLSRGALSGLDASAAITPAMLAKHHLPGIMLGNGPRPIRYVMGELTQCVPGFSRIPPAKARRLVVAALESRSGGGLDGNVAFCKTGWGRWDAHVKGSSRDSGIGSFNDGHMSPPRSELSSYAVSHGDSGVHMRGPRLPCGYRDQHSGGSWTASSLREEDELDMDVPEHEADKMSLDGQSSPPSSDDDSSSSMNDDTDDDDWAAVGAAALRKASLPAPGAPRTDYKALCIPARWPSRSWSRRPSAHSHPPIHSTSLPQSADRGLTAAAAVAAANGSWSTMSARVMDPSLATPEEKAAVAALLSLGSM